MKFESKKYTYISLFSGAGVGCYGFKMNDFQCIATNELLDARIEIQKANKKCKYNSGYISGDIISESNKQHLFREVDFWKNHEKIDSVDVIVATPPCQGMSSANYKKNNEQKRNSLVVEAIKIIQEIRPRVFVFENVRSFMKTICTDLDGKDKAISESINCNLSKYYNIHSKVINFKDYRVPSSRPRTIVIGTLKEMKNVSPFNLFPTKHPEITVREAIGDLKPLAYGEYDKDDIYHFARLYPKYMEDWIAPLKEGQSAFDNPDEIKPYRIVNGEKQILKSGFMGNKFRRLFWDKSGACIATRNDQLASMDTIHPSDNRVLSIRELMRLMSIPESFCWTEDEKNILDRDEFLKKNELNIRRCIGEAVPTGIMKQISANIKTMLEFEDFVDNYSDSQRDVFLKIYESSDNFYIRTFCQESILIDPKKTGSFYTPQSVVYNSLKSFENSKVNDEINILEPSVGLGAFLPQLLFLVSDSDKVNIDVVDLSKDAIKTLKKALKLLDIPSNVKINFYNLDFLTQYKVLNNKKYDLVITNPPYGKVDNGKLLIYRKTFNEQKIRNTFAFFMKKLANLSDEIICIIPKTFTMAKEYENIRKMYESFPIVAINDFGVKFFKKVFVEIISIHFKQGYTNDISICDHVYGQTIQQPQKYIFDNGTWLLYKEYCRNNHDIHLVNYNMEYDLLTERDSSSHLIKSYIPDIVIEKGGQTIAVFDVKYKNRLRQNRDDSHQLMSYVLLMNVSKCGFIFPSSSGDCGKVYEGILNIKDSDTVINYYEFENKSGNDFIAELEAVF